MIRTYQKRRGRRKAFYWINLEETKSMTRAAMLQVTNDKYKFGKGSKII
jgi:hypothetical protein